jgi:hypothetical protein
MLSNVRKCVQYAVAMSQIGDGVMTLVQAAVVSTVESVTIVGSLT